MNKTIKHLIFYFFIITTFSCYAQKVDSKETIDCIKEGVVNFFININRIEKSENINAQYDNIGVMEILKDKLLGYNINGIYRITDYSSHRGNYLLLKKGDAYKILSFYNLTSTFNDITFFLEELNYSKKEITEYLEGVVGELKTHYESKWDNQVAPREQKWMICKQ